MSDTTPSELETLLDEAQSLCHDDDLAPWIDRVVPFGTAAVPGLLALLNASASMARRAGVLALGRLEARSAGARIVSLLESDQHALVKAAAAWSAGRLGLEAVATTLAALLKSEVPRLRKAAAGALAELGQGQFSGDLVPLLEDADEGVRGEVAGALGKLGDAACLEPLLLAFDCEEAYPLHEVLAAAAGDVVRRCGEPGATESLARLEVGLCRRVLEMVRHDGSRATGPLIKVLEAVIGKRLDPEVIAGFGVDLVSEARERDTPAAYGRDAEVEAVLRRLSEAGPRSLVLVGPPGCGKTAIVEEVARRAAGGEAEIDVLLSATTGAVLRGTKWIGEWQTRLTALVDAIRRPRRGIWYVPDLANLETAGSTSRDDESFIHVLGPFMERGDVVLIGEATPETYRSAIESSPRLRRLFHPVRVEAMDRQATTRVIDEVVARWCGGLESRGTALITFAEEAREKLLDLTEGYLPGIALPGKAVSLLNQVFARALERTSKGGAAATEVGPPHVIEAVSAQTGLPQVLVDDAAALDEGELRRFFSERVLGQPEAVRALVERIMLIKAGVTDPSRPFGVFFFVGPTGVGKTEIGKALAEYLFGSADRMIRLDMSEYKDPLSFEKLIGNPQAGEKSALGRGQLTSRIREQPFSVILIDEVEKAHPNVFDLFLQVFDDGRLSDARGESFDFRQTIIIMTSNLGSDLRRSSLGFAVGAVHDGHEPSVLKEMEDTFLPEFLNRIDEVVVFGALDTDVMRKIAQRELGRVLMRSGIARRRAIVDVQDSVVELLVNRGFHPEYGARPLKREVEKLVLLPLARRLMEVSDPGTLLQIRADQGRVSVRVAGARPSVAEAGEVESAAAPGSAGRPSDRHMLDPRTEELSQRVERLGAWCDERGFLESKEELLKRTWQVTFWDDTAAARRVLTEIDVLERLLGSVERLRKRCDDLRRFVDWTLNVPGGEAQLPKALSWSDELKLEVDFAEYAARCRDPRERSDAFVVLGLVGRDGADSGDLERLQSMYAGWARGKGFKASLVLCQGEDRAGDSGVTLLVEGFCAAGLLAGEAGLHRMVRGRSSKAEREVAFVRVEVIPWDGGDRFPLRSQDLKTEVRSLRRETGPTGERLRTRVRIEHRAGNVVVQGRSPEGNEDVVETLMPLVRARLAASDGADDGEDAVVRTYHLSPTPWVREERLGEKSGDLQTVLDGDLDRYIRPRLKL